MPTSPSTLVLQPKDQQRPAKLALTFPLDDAFTEWLDELPSLDRQESEASESEIRNDQRLGATQSERDQTIEEGRNRAKIFSTISTVLGLWAIIYPRPYVPLILLLATLPWIALEVVRRSHGLFRVEEVRNGAHPNVAVALLLPACALALRAIHDFDVLQSPLAVGLYVAVGGALALGIFSVDSTVRHRKLAVIALCAVSLVYGYGAAIEANALLDRSSGTSYSAIVQGKHITTGKNRAYKVTLGPWGPKATSNDLQVSRATYQPIQPGDVVLLTLKQGALGVKWFYMRAWQQGNERSNN
jgi:hypothetical protein